MLSNLLSNIWPLLAGVAAVMLGLFGLYSKGKSAGVDQQKVKEAEDRDKNLEDVKRAADAAAAVKPGDSLHDDPNNRDNWRV